VVYGSKRDKSSKDTASRSGVNSWRLFRKQKVASTQFSIKRT
jgi:hypothetical protein